MGQRAWVFSLCAAASLDAGANRRQPEIRAAGWHPKRPLYRGHGRGMEASQDNLTDEEERLLPLRDQIIIQRFGEFPIHSSPVILRSVRPITPVLFLKMPTAIGC